MNKLKTAVFALAAMFIFTGCSVQNNSGNIAKINNTVITQKEFDKAYETVASNNMFSQMGIDLQKDPDNVFALMMKERVMSELMVNALIREETEKRKITVTKEDIAKAEEEVIGKFGNKEQFMQILKMNGVDYSQFKKDLEAEIKIKKFVDSIAMVSIGESEAKKYYDENADKFKYPQKVRASHILIVANPEQIKSKIRETNKDISDEELETQTQQQMDAKLAKAQKLQAQVKNLPSSFAKVAKENSQDPGSAINGGDLGFFSKEEMVEQFSDVAFKLAPNTVSEVVQTPYGYHIIMVTDRAEAGVYGFEETKKDIINYLEGQDKKSILANKIESLRKEANIEFYKEEYNPENIQKKIKEVAAENVPQEFGRNPEN